MLLKSEVKVNEIYAYDVEDMCSNIHKLTKTIKILEIGNDGLLTVECQQTGQLFNCGTNMLTTIDRVKRMYDGYKNAVLEDQEKDHEMYSYNKTIKKMEDVLFQLELNTL